jgi:hypothetical protein
MAGAGRAPYHSRITISPRSTRAEGIVEAYLATPRRRTPLRSPELTTAAFAFSYVSSWVAVLASVPVAILARQRSLRTP